MSKEKLSGLYKNKMQKTLHEADGKKAVVHFRNGDVIEGVLFGFNPWYNEPDGKRCSIMISDSKKNVPTGFFDSDVESIEIL